MEVLYFIFWSFPINFKLLIFTIVKCVKSILHFSKAQIYFAFVAVYSVLSGFAQRTAQFGWFGYGPMGLSARGRRFLGSRFGVISGVSYFGLPVLFLPVSPVVHKILSMYVWNSNRLYFWIATASCGDGTGATRSPLPHSRPSKQFSGILDDSWYLLCTQDNEHAEQIDTSHTCIVKTDNNKSWNVYICWLVVLDQLLLISIGPTVSTDGYIVIYFLFSHLIASNSFATSTAESYAPLPIASPHQLVTDNDAFLITPVIHIPLFFRFVNKGRDVNQPSINLLRLSYLDKYVLHNPTTMSPENPSS